MKNGKFTIVILFIFFILTATWLVSRYYHSLIYTPINPADEKIITFVINSGESGASVGRRLVAANLIRSPLFFRIYLRLNQLSGGAIQAGSYELSSSMSLAETVEVFRHGTFDVKLTIPEGLRIEEVTELISNFDPPVGGQISNFSEEFLAEAKAKNFSYEFLKDVPADATLEGFLFPDTYFMPKDINAHDLIDLFLTNFDEKFDTQLREDLKKENLNIFETIVFASIVEREAKKEEDRPLVAGILIKRLKNGWPLEADATVQYAIANSANLLNSKLIRQLADQNSKLIWWKEELTEEDLDIDSPYNTRKYPGLPPGPIANPGLSSIKSVCYPKESEYWYYISDNQGNIYYSTTFAEHQNKVALYAQ